MMRGNNSKHFLKTCFTHNNKIVLYLNISSSFFLADLNICTREMAAFYFCYGHFLGHEKNHLAFPK